MNKALVNAVEFAQNYHPEMKSAEVPVACEGRPLLPINRVWPQTIFACTSHG